MSQSITPIAPKKRSPRKIRTLPAATRTSQEVTLAQPGSTSQGSSSLISPGSRASNPGAIAFLNWVLAQNIAELQPLREAAQNGDVFGTLYAFYALFGARYVKPPGRPPRPISGTQPLLEGVPSGVLTIKRAVQIALVGRSAALQIAGEGNFSAPIRLAMDSMITALVAAKLPQTSTRVTETLHERHRVKA